MRVFTHTKEGEYVNQGSPWWWSLRRGVPTSSGFDRIITPKKMKPSEQAMSYALELAADVSNQQPNWFTERMGKPPNKAVSDGIAREAESRRWFEMERDCSVVQVAFVLHDSGLYGASPDGLIVADSGALAGTLELKNPMRETQAGYLLEPDTLPSAYRPQCHGHLLVTGLPRCSFLSYCPDLPGMIVEVGADEFTVALKEALEHFTVTYLSVLDKLRLRNRFNALRSSILAHFPEGEWNASPDHRPEPVPPVQR